MTTRRGAAYPELASKAFPCVFMRFHAFSWENNRSGGAATKARVDIAALGPHIGLMIRSLFQDYHGIA
jgi:hypothetical protein